MPKRHVFPAILSLTLLAGLACGTKDQSIDRTFDPCEPLGITADASEVAARAAIRDAAEMWNQLASTRLELVDGDAALVPVQLESAVPADLGLYDDERGIIILNRNTEPGRPLTITVAHELGHAMGLVHVKSSERRSVMVPGNKDTPPGEFDRETLVAIWGQCPARE